MTTDHEIYRHGWQLLKAHGVEARREALRRAREFEQRGAQSEAESWHRVASAITEIAKSIPSMSMH